MQEEQNGGGSDENANKPNGKNTSECARRGNGVKAPNSDSARVDATMVELGLKGSGKLCEAALVPPSMILPSACIIGQVLQPLSFLNGLFIKYLQTYTKTIQLVNSSTSSLDFEFKYAADPHILAVSVNPLRGMCNSLIYY